MQPKLHSEQQRQRTRATQRGKNNKQLDGPNKRRTNAIAHLLRGSFAQSGADTC